MGILSIILTVLFVIVAILLVAIVLIQDEDGASLGGVFAGSSNTAFGSRSANVVQKFTYTLGVLFFALALGMAFVNKTVDAAPVIQAEDSGKTSEWWTEGAAAPATETPAPAAADTVPATN